jgi:hypothetical protein
MENLPFLKQQQSEPPSRSAPENEWPESPRRFEPIYAPPVKKDLLESLKENQLALILLGIVAGFLLANMRPVVFQAK